ncbi:hypothetical protein F-E9_519 [Faustovirus]|nr:hypothetical protein F-E9_519 [Faustovirus]
MQAAVDTIVERINAGLARKLKLVVRGNDVERRICLNYKGYECFILLQVICVDEGKQTILMRYYDNIDLRIRCEDYTFEGVDEAIVVYLARLNMFIA